MRGLKVPVDYSNQFWSDKILVLFCEGSKPNISMISGFLPPGMLINGLDIPTYFKKYKKIMETCSKKCVL